MTKLSTLIVVALASLGLAAGCKKKAEPTPEPVGSGAGTGTGDTMAGTGAGTGDTMAGSGSGDVAPPAEDTADKLEVIADHVDKTKGKVTVTFSGVKVVKADFDPAKIEGGSADVEVDLASLSTGIEKRDNHLKSPDYIDVGKFAKVTIHVDNVKKTGDKTFTGDATVKLRDLEKKYPVTFEVVDQQADSIRIKGETKLSRLDFKVGKEKEDVEPELIAKLQVTVKKT